MKNLQCSFYVALSALVHHLVCLPVNTSHKVQFARTHITCTQNLLMCWMRVLVIKFTPIATSSPPANWTLLRNELWTRMLKATIKGCQPPALDLVVCVCVCICACDRGSLRVYLCEVPPQVIGSDLISSDWLIRLIRFTSEWERGVLEACLNNLDLAFVLIR